MNGKSRLKKIVGIVLFALLAGLFAVLFDMRGVLLHPEDRGLTEISAENADVLAGADGTWIIAFKDAENRRPRYVERLRAEIFLPDDRPALIREMIRYFDSGVTEHTDHHPVYVGFDVIRIRRDNVSVIELSPEGAGRFSLGRIYVDNEPVPNKYLFVFTALCAALFLALFCFRRDLSERPELCFLAACLLLGTALTVSLPRNKVGYDEETHLQAVMDMASFPSGELHLSPAIMDQMLVTEHNNPDAQPGNAAEMALFDAYLNEHGDYKTGVRTPAFHTMKNRMPAYAAMAFAVKAGKFLSLPWSRLLLLARMANLCQYALLMALAIRLAPFGRRLLFLIGLFPQNLFLASTVSYDPFVIGCLSIGTAAGLRLMTVGEKALPRDMLLMAGFLFLGCLPKAVYAPMILLCLAVPKERFRNGAERRIFLCACLFLFLLLLGTFILPTAVAPADTGDMRGGEVSELSQVGFILQNPFAYAWILLRQMFFWIPQCWFGADCITFMGHLVNGNTASKGLVVPYLFLLVLTVVLDLLGPFRRTAQGPSQETAPETAQKAGTFQGFGVRQRIWTLLLVGASAVLIWTSMYVAFTPPGADTISGVQGRYFLPLFWPLYLLLSRTGQDGGKLESGGLLCYYLLIVPSCVLAALSVYLYAVRPFCL